MLLRRLTLLGLATLSFTLPLRAAEFDPAARAKLDAELAAVANDPQHLMASLSVLAIRDGKVVYQNAWGRRYIDPNNAANDKPANVDTLYRIASISKMVTSLGVMKLVEAGKLDLDADVSQYLGFTLRNPNFPQQAITLRHLMSHTSSLRDDGGYNFDPKIAIREWLLPDGAKYGKGEVWAKDKGPGYFTYVNLNWGVIGTVMERASGERFDRLMKRLVLDPLGVAGGYHAADFSAQELANLSVLYRRRVEIDGKEIWRPDGPWIPQTEDYSKAPPAPRAAPDYLIGSNGTVFGPQGSLRISATGLGKIMLMLMNDGQANGSAFLSKQSIATMFGTQWSMNAEGTNGYSWRGLFQSWGLGVQHLTNKRDRLVADGSFNGSGHFGNAWGLTSVFFADLKKKDGMIYMIGGTAWDPDTTMGSYSAMWRHEERILDALYRHALKRD